MRTTTLLDLADMGHMVHVSVKRSKNLNAVSPFDNLILANVSAGPSVSGNHLERHEDLSGDWNLPDN